MAELRHKLALGKYLVTRVVKHHLGFEMVIDLGNSIKLTCVVPPSSDVREGDVLTLYTEVLVKEPASGQVP